MKTSLLALIALMAVPAVSVAATYHYIDTTGTVRTVEADTAAEAFVEAENIASHSGVAIDMGVLDGGDSVSMTSTDMYQYVSITGDVQFVSATSPQAALIIPGDIAPHSGVLDTDMGMVPPETDVSL